MTECDEQTHKGIFSTKPKLLYTTIDRNLTNAGSAENTGKLQRSTTASRTLQATEHRIARHKRNKSQANTLTGIEEIAMMRRRVSSGLTGGDAA